MPIKYGKINIPVPAFGTEPFSPLSAITTDFAWSGNTTPSTATVIGRLSSGTEARLVLSPSSDFSTWRFTTPVTAVVDGLCKFDLTDLEPNTDYYYDITADDEAGNGYTGHFKTPPSGAASFKVLAGSCHGNTQPVLDIMRTEHDDALMYLQYGDLHYDDNVDNDVSNFYASYRGVFNQVSSTAKALFASMAVAYCPDDHDGTGNDGNSLSASNPALKQAYDEYVPHYPLASPGYASGNGLYFTFVIGRVQFIFLDCRTQSTGDSAIGDPQEDWLYDTLDLAVANNRVSCIVSGTPWIGGLGDAFSAFSTMKTRIFNYITTNSIPVFVVSGDTHNVAFDDGTALGFPVFSIGSINAGGQDKGGTYTCEGVVNKFQHGQQYGTIEVVDSGGATIDVTVTGYRNNGGVNTQLITYTHEFTV